MTDQMPFASAPPLDDRICAEIDAMLQPTGLRFALVLWVPGEAHRPASIAVSAHPRDQETVPTALLTALSSLADASSPNRRDDRPVLQELANRLRDLAELRRDQARAASPSHRNLDGRSVRDQHQRDAERLTREADAVERVLSTAPPVPTSGLMDGVFATVESIGGGGPESLIATFMARFQGPDALIRAWAVQDFLAAASADDLTRRIGFAVQEMMAVEEWPIEGLALNGQTFEDECEAIGAAALKALTDRNWNDGYSSARPAERPGGSR